MSAKRRITDATIKGLKPAPKGKRVEVFDSIVPAFGIRSTDKAVHSYICYARFNGVPSRRTIAPVGRITLAEARAQAKAWAEAAARGIDPAEEARKARAAEAGRVTFGKAMEEFVKRHVRKQRKARDVEREIRRELMPRFADRPVAEITRKDIAKMLGEIRDRGAIFQAHHVLGHVRRFYNWLLAQPEFEDDVVASPCDRLKANDVIGAKHHRERVLDDEELRAVWRAADRLGYPWGPLYKLLLLTGARKSEWSDASWREVDLDEGLLTVPSARFKIGKVHLIPLCAEARTLLAEMPRWEEGDFIFSTRGGAIPVDGFSKAKRRLDELVDKELGHEPEPFIIHDFRRTCRTRLSQLRVEERVAERVVGHVPLGIKKVYDQWEYIDERREALDLWDARLRSIVEPPPPNVTDLAERRARA